MIVATKNNKIIGVDKKLLDILNVNLENLSEKINIIDLSFSAMKNNLLIEIDNHIFKVEEINFLNLENIRLFYLKEEKEEIKEKTLTKSEPEVSTPTENKTSSAIPEFDELIINGEDNFNQPQQPTQPQFQAHIHQQPTQTQSFQPEPQFSLDNELNMQSPSPLKEPEVSTPAENKTSSAIPEFDELIINGEDNFNQPQQPTQPQPQAYIHQQPTQTQSFQPEPQFSLDNELNVEPVKKQPIKLSFEDDFKEINELLELDKNEVKNKINEELQKAAEELGIDLDTIKELFEVLLEQYQENKAPFYEAIKNKDYETLHKIAHSLKGASLNLRLANLGLILKYIDEQSKERVPIEKMAMLINKFYNFVDKITDNDNTQLFENIDIDEYTKQLIKETIENYKITKNEKKLQKDLKYIKKILGVEVNSIEDLERLIKD